MRRPVTLAMLLAGLAFMVEDAGAQSLGELAIREAARRAAITTPSRSYSNKAPIERERIELPVPAPAAATAWPTVPPVKVAARQIAAPPQAAPVHHPSPKAVRPAAGPTPPPSSLAGWKAFQIKKTGAELAETARLAADPQVVSRTVQGDVILPAQRDVLRLSTGVSYLQGADWGGEFSGTGKINGMQVDISSFFTAGPMGFQSRSGRASVLAPGGQWRAEGGDLYSDLRGLARGGRLSWSVGQKWTPSVALYLPRRGGAGPTVVGYRDRFQVLPRVRLGGELTSDGAAFMQGHYAQPTVDLTAFYRVTRGPAAGRDAGVSGALTLGRIVVSGALRRSNAVADSRRWQIASIKLPLAHQASVTLERSWWTGSADDGATNALTLQLPLGPVRVIQRLQWGRTDYRHRAVPFGFGRRQSQSSASYRPGPWASLNYQQSTQWFDDGTLQEWDEISSMLQLGRRTTAQFVTAFPDVADPRRFRGRLTHQLSRTLQLEAQFGRLSAFQMTPASSDEQSRVMVTVRKTWQVTSPSRGGEIRGRAIDQSGYGVQGALVRLGPYSAVTDETGAYTFARVPDGQFDLALDKAKLPAAYAWDDLPRPVTVTRTSRETVDLQVIPLNTIRGRVYHDRNHNGFWDEDEGIPNAVVGVNGSVTATSATGSYAFYNQPPGHYTIRLDVKRLAKGLAPASPAELAVELTPDHPLIGIDFKVEKKDMPIIMREIRK